VTIELHYHLLLPAAHEKLAAVEDGLPVLSEHLLLVHFPNHGELEASLNFEE